MYEVLDDMKAELSNLKTFYKSIFSDQHPKKDSFDLIRLGRIARGVEAKIELLEDLLSRYNKKIFKEVK